MMQKIMVVGYNSDEDQPVTEQEVTDAMSSLSLDNVYVNIQEL